MRKERSKALPGREKKKALLYPEVNNETFLLAGRKRRKDSFTEKLPRPLGFLDGRK
jgi:hypothetical protein